MKKAQILSALALAFALGLGVVAPVANTYAVTPRAAGATDVKEFVGQQTFSNAISAVEKDVKYDAYKVVSEASATGANAWTAVDEDTAKSDIVSKIQGVNSDYTAKTNATLADVLADAAKQTNYGRWEKLYTEMTKTSGTTVSAIKALAQGLLNLTGTDDELNNIDTVKAAINANTTYQAYEDLIEAVTDTTKALKTQAERLAVLPQAIKNTGAVAANAYNAVAENEDATLTDWVNLAKTIDLTSGEGQKYVTLQTAVTTAEGVIDTNKNNANYDYADALATLKQAYKTATGKDLAVTSAGDNQGTNKKVTLTTENVTVTGEFEDGVVMTVEKVERKVAAFGTRKTAMYDITLTKDGKAYKFDGSAVVTIDFKDAKIDASKAGLYYVKEDGTADFMKGAKFEGTTVTFTTSHFSVYAIVEDAAAGLPNTGVISAAVEGNASTTVAMVAGIATALTAAGAGVVAYRNARRSVRK